MSVIQFGVGLEVEGDVGTSVENNRSEAGWLSCV